MPRLTTRDYKRTSRASGAAKLKEFGLGVVVGAVLASAAFLIAGAHARHRAAASSAHTHAGPDSEDAPPHAPAPDDSSSNGSAAAAATSAGAQTPHYDFYRMLPSFKVPVHRDDDRASRPPPPPVNDPTAAAPPRPAYLLQVGSYRSTAEADQVRGRLARAGISAQVQHVVDGSRIWNRVRIGPLSDAELEKVREQLRTANIHALLIRADR